MLASPLLPSLMFSPQHTSEESMHYRPSKDLETFNSLLPPPIEFIEGSSSGTLAVAEGKYEAINSSPRPSKAELHGSPKAPMVSLPQADKASARSTSVKIKSLYPGAIDMSWPVTCNRGTGLYNSGNTCFLNSALQCLLHTPPLLKLLIAHRVDDWFCMACNLRAVAVRAHKAGGASFSPSTITNNLQTIAKHLRKGRQEDTHEFLRYAIDSLQKSCLHGYPPKIDPKIAETTWVHKLFGGRLRSRVTCRDCGHNSDTFDRILDLSLDIFKCDSLREALRKFIAIDYLKGADKYKCEKCKKYVNAEKRFTIHEAPLVLTVHLKRFSPLGRKIGHALQYDDELSLQPFMSADQFGPSYSLYGVICHAGGGPNSGHYYSYVKSKEGRWWEMNDEMVQAVGKATDKKTAYMLFYIQNKGQGLEAAMNAPSSNHRPSVSMRNGLAAGMKKRDPRDSEAGDEDRGVKVDASFIGPLIPSPVILESGASPKSPNGIDPQAMSLKSKITAIAAARTMESLGNYGSDSEPDTPSKPDMRQPDTAMDLDVKDKQKDRVPVSGNPKHPSSPPPTASALSLPRLAIPAASFYASAGSKGKKRKSPDSATENHNTPKKLSSNLNETRTNGYVAGSNPYNRHTPHAQLTYSRRHANRRMGI
ncbi:hypothetical protein B0H34DRAFT_780385 [Crassisporium funariophilum]|nr:hypothetical protein B0H34DRAFT_780385 [Crassisporium funariophilum]